MSSGIENLFPVIFIIGITVSIFTYYYFYLTNKWKTIKEVAAAFGYKLFLADNEIPINNSPRKGDSSLDFGQFFSFAMGSWIIEGESEAGKIKIFEESRGGGKSKTVYTIIDFSPTKSLDFDLEISKQGFFTNIGIKVFNLQDIIIGEEPFDKTFRIQGENPEKVKYFLSDNLIKDSILKLFEVSEFVIYRDLIHYEIRGSLKNFEQYKSIVDPMNQYGEKIYNSNSSFF